MAKNKEMVGEFKDWRDATPEVELAGRRLDLVRALLKDLKPGTWAHNHWKIQEAQMLLKWQLMAQLRQTGLRQKAVGRKYTIDYNWWEGDVGGGGMISQFLHQGDVQEGLNRSWDRAREQFRQKAMQGLV